MATLIGVCGGGCEEMRRKKREERDESLRFVARGEGEGRVIGTELGLGCGGNFLDRNSAPIVWTYCTRAHHFFASYLSHHPLAFLSYCSHRSDQQSWATWVSEGQLKLLLLHAHLVHYLSRSPVSFHCHPTLWLFLVPPLPLANHGQGVQDHS